MIDQLVGGASLRIPMAYDAYLALGETKHHEYYDGLCVVNPPSRRHSRAVAKLPGQLRPACPPTHEVLVGWGWRVAEARDFEPDLMISDRSAPDDDILRQPPPLLVVEVSSPSTRDADRVTKLARYAEGGAAWYWVVDLVLAEIVVFENRGGSFVERQRIAGAQAAVGPFPVVVDPRVLGEP